jgi:hypothetical protein
MFTGQYPEAGRALIKAGKRFGLFVFCPDSDIGYGE